MPQLINYSLDLLNFPRGILVFLPGLVFFLGSTEQYKAMKLESHFSDQNWIYGAFPKFYLFSGHFLNLGWKRGAPGDTWRARRVPGKSLGAGLSGQRTRRAPGRGARGSATWDTWLAREHPEELPARVSSGHASYSQGSRIWFRVRHSGTGVAFGGFRGGVTRGARDALGSFREACGALGASGDTWRIRGIRSKYHSRGSRRTRVLPGGLRRTWSLLVTRGAFGGYRVLSLAGLHGALGDFRREASSALGARGLLRNTPKKVP